MFRIAVCDDRIADQQRLTEHIRRNEIDPKSIQIYEFSSGQELLKSMDSIRFDIIFLDIQMNGMNGNETAKRIRNRDSSLVLVFYTGYAEPSPHSFEVQPYRYIMKNMTEAQISQYVSDSMKKMRESSAFPTFLVSIERRKMVIRASHIVYIEKYVKSTRVHLTKDAYDYYEISADENGKYPDIRLHDKLENIYSQLKGYGFGQPHTSYLINFNYLVDCRANILRLDGIPNRIPISRSKSKEFHSLKNTFIRSKYMGR